MQENTNWYWAQQPLQQTIIVTTRTIIHPHFDVAGITDVKDTPKHFCNVIQENKPYKVILFV